MSKWLEALLVWTKVGSAIIFLVTVAAVVYKCSKLIWNWIV